MNECNHGLSNKFTISQAVPSGSRTKPWIWRFSETGSDRSHLAQATCFQGRFAYAGQTPRVRNVCSARPATRHHPCEQQRLPQTPLSTWNLGSLVGPRPVLKPMGARVGGGKNYGDLMA